MKLVDIMWIHDCGILFVDVAQTYGVTDFSYFIFVFQLAAFRTANKESTGIGWGSCIFHTCELHSVKMCTVLNYLILEKMLHTGTFRCVFAGNFREM